jgi:NAD(P)H-binding
MKACIVGASGKFGRYMVQHALDRGYDVVGVYRKASVAEVDEFTGRITLVCGKTDDREVIRRAVAGRDGVLVVLVPRGVHGYSTGTAQAVLDLLLQFAHRPRRQGRLPLEAPGDREGLRADRAPRSLRRPGRSGRGLQARLRQRYTLDGRPRQRSRGTPSQGLPVWSRHVGDPILASNLTRRVDFALLIVDALTNDELDHDAPAIAGR